MRVLIIGANGQLGKCLADTKPEKLDLISYSKEEFDLLDIDKCLQKIDRDKPNYVINAAAYTAVDKAETEQEIDIEPSELNEQDSSEEDAEKND